MSESSFVTATSNPVIQTFGSGLESDHSFKYSLSNSDHSYELTLKLGSPDNLIKLDNPNTAITSDDLIGWLRLPEVGAVLAGTLGLPTEGLLETGRVENIASPFPNCTSENLTCSLLVSDDGEILLLDFAEQYGLKSYTLPNLIASIAYQKQKKLKGPEFITWCLRLFMDAGLIHPASVPMPPCPDNASENVQRVYNGFQYLLQCKWRYENGFGQPTAFARNFAAAWCGLSVSSAHRAKIKLMKSKVIHMVGVHPGRWSCGIFLPWNGDSNGTETLPTKSN